MYVLKIGDVLALDSLQPHEDMQDKLLQYDESMMGPCVFVSHTWLRNSSPDNKKGEKLALLKALLSRAVAEKGDIDTDEQVWVWTMKSLRVKAKALKTIEYVWLDFASIRAWLGPQILDT